MLTAWEQTFHEPRAHTVPVEVHTTSAADTATARRVLEERGPLRLSESSGAGR